LGFGGHTQALWRAIQPGGHLLSLDADPIEFARTTARLQAAGMTPETWTARRCNFAGLMKALGDQGWHGGVEVIFADLGLSSMQIDNPARGFTFKTDGPLDMRMNPQRGKSAAAFLAEVSVPDLQALLEENADESRAACLAEGLVRQADSLTTTRALADAVRRLLPGKIPASEMDLTVRRVFQALRIAVNDEFGALDTLLRHLPLALRSGGRVAILTFHSGEDRRVKKALQDGRRAGHYRATADEIIRPSREEQRRNPRSSSAKLRWAVRA
jgi:16S rRNA (cytosine1402-N4)-methyltransferase